MFCKGPNYTSVDAELILEKQSLAISNLKVQDSSHSYNFWNDHVSMILVGEEGSYDSTQSGH